MSAAVLEATLTLALVGQPNVGKSTVFNQLTGQTRYVSNWPGKTCDVKVGLFPHRSGGIHIVDLPGTYSLTSNSPDEMMVRDFLINCRPDVVAVMVDARSLERNLYLVAELLNLEIPLVLGLNMLDVAEQQGIKIDPHVLEAALGFPVVPMAASQGRGLDELIHRAVQVEGEQSTTHPTRPEIQEDHRTLLEHIETCIADYLPREIPRKWAAVKVLEADDQITGMLQERMGEAWQGVEQLLVQHDDAFLAVASGRYEWIGRMVRAAVARPKAGQLAITDRIDRFATHPVTGMALLAVIMGGLFWLTYAVGGPIQAMLETQVEGFVHWFKLTGTWGPGWLINLLADGVITGVGTVLTLMPILLIFFTGLGFLEDVGYIARAAFVMDRFMHLMGLHGKSFLPVFLGFGCNVPAIMGTRVIESPKARLITILITPLIPCTARMSVVALLAPIFFGEQAVWVTLALIGLALVIFTGLGVGFHELVLGGEHTSFIMELPLYNTPNLRTIFQGVYGRVADFIKGAATVILVVSVIMWFFSTYPGGNIESSYLAAVGRWLAPLGSMMGLEWQMMVALLTSFVRKENTIPTLAVLYGTGSDGMGLAGMLGLHMSPASALAFLAAQVLFIPCVATVATIHQETKSWKWTLVNIALLLVISMSVGIIIYQAFARTGWGM